MEKKDNEEQFKKIMTIIIIVCLGILLFFLIEPLLKAIIFGIILAFIFSPVYDWTYAKTKSKNLSATLISIFLILIIIIPFWYLMPIIIKQSIQLFSASQQIDLIMPLKKVFPSLFASDQFSNQVGAIFKEFILNFVNSSTNSLAQLVLNAPTLALQLLVVAFTFFFVLRDKDILVEYIKTLLPFSKEVESKLFDYSKRITSSVIYGQIIIGMLQGIIAGIGFFIFGVPNALFLTLVAVVASLFPILGPYIVWVPVVIFLIIAGNNLSAVGVTAFGILASTIDNFIRPIFVSRRTRMHSALVLIGMIGGLFLFGILGFILGPLIIAYSLVILEIYRNKKSLGLIIEGEKR